MITFLEKSLPRHLAAIRKCYAATGCVRPSDVTTSNAVEEFFSLLRSGGGSYARNPSGAVAASRAKKIREQALRKGEEKMKLD
jgi:hypothetical protein